jgi:putative polyhydroxyalkanoate system protein
MQNLIKEMAVADISIKRAHGGTLADARKMADKVAVKLEKDYQLKSSWAGDVMNFTRSGVNGTLVISAKDLKIDIKLGFLASAFKTTIADAVEKNLDALIKPAKTGETKAATKPTVKKTAK